MYNPLTKKPPLVILGMHRSGTSCLAGTLEEAGVYLGEVFRWNPHNLKGNRENREIMRLHDSILTYNGGGWSDPPGVSTPEWTQNHRATRDQIIAGYDKFGRWRLRNAYWGFKDPRTLLVFEGWLEVFPSITAVGIFRHPASVVRSLQRRDESLTTEMALSLWAHYNRKLSEYQEKMGFPLVCFDDSEDELRGKFLEILGRLGLGRDRLEFFDPGLRSGGDGELPLTPAVEGLYQDLRSRAL